MGRTPRPRPAPALPVRPRRGKPRPTERCVCPARKLRRRWGVLGHHGSEAADTGAQEAVHVTRKGPAGLNMVKDEHGRWVKIRKDVHHNNARKPKNAKARKKGLPCAPPPAQPHDCVSPEAHAPRIHP